MDWYSIDGCLIEQVLRGNANSAQVIQPGPPLQKLAKLYPPGNARQLENEAKHVFALVHGKIITKDHQAKSGSNARPQPPEIN